MRLKSYIKFCYAMWLLLICQVAVSQIYPVASTLITRAPHGPSLHSFTNAGNSLGSTNQLDLQLVLNDLTEPQLMVGLQIEMTGDNLSFSSSVGNYPLIQNLLPGQPVFLDNSDLQAFFNPSSLSGYNLDAFFNNDGFIPEGTYEICFTAYELTHNSQVSNKACSFMFIEIYDPPEIIYPIGQIQPQVPQNILAGWQPLHFASFPVQYTFEVWEAIEGLSPDQVVQSTFPVYTFQTSITNQILDENNLPLWIGKEYLCRVTVRDVVNGPMSRPVYLFKNNGSSPVVSFFYGLSGGDDSEYICEAPTDCEHVISPDNKAYLSWNEGEAPIPNYDQSQENENALGGLDGENTEGSNNNQGGSENAYTDQDLLGLGGETQGPVTDQVLFYRVYWKEIESDDWSFADTEEEYYVLDALKNGVIYDCYVQTICQNGTAEGEPFIIKMPNFPPPRDYYCGQPPLEYDTDNMDPLPNLNVGDTIIAYDSRVIITEITGGNTEGGGDGRYSGEGFFTAPMLRSVKVAVKFNNIFVNDESRVVEGKIITKFDPTGSNVMDADAIADLLGNDDFEVTDTIIAGVIDTVYINDAGQVVVLVEGSTEPQLFDQPIIITDEAGNSYQIAGGYVMPIINIQPSDEFMPGYEFTFVQSPDMRYGFDPPKDAIKDEYEEVDGRLIAYKAISIAGNDKIRANYVFPSPQSIDSLKIVTEDGVVLEHTKLSDSQIEINLVGQNEGLTGVYAYIEPRGFVGKLNLWSNYLTTYKVHFVPINNCISNSDIEAQYDLISKSLSQGVVKFEFDILNVGLNDIDADGIDAEKGILTTYSEDMERVIGNFKSLHQTEDFHFYVFLSDNLKGSAGNMPRGRAGGFVDVTAPNWGHIAAHELGHGAFTLKHAWEIYNVSANDMLENLMDYSGQSSLLYKQWKKMHDQSLVISWLSGSESSAYVVIDLSFDCLTDNLRTKIPSDFTFLSPDNKNIKLNVTDKPLSVIKSVGSGQNWQQGALAHFERDGVSYEPSFSTLGHTFLGYRSTEDYQTIIPVSELLDQTNQGQAIVINKESNPCRITLGEEEPIDAEDCECDEQTNDLFNKDLEYVRVRFATDESDPGNWVQDWKTVELKFASISWAKDYRVSIKLNNDATIDYQGGILQDNSGNVQSAVIGTFSNGTNRKEYSVKLNRNDKLGNVRIRKKDIVEYHIYPLLNVDDSAAKAPYYYKAESGKFYYNYEFNPGQEIFVDQSICQGNTAKLGVTYQNNDWEDPCSATPIIEEVNPTKYTFDWVGSVGVYSIDDCNLSGLNSRASASPQENSIYELHRSHRKKDYLFLVDQNYSLPTIESVVDEAQIHVNVWERGSDDYLNNCEFYLRAVDLTYDPEGLYGQANLREVTSGDDPPLLEIVKEMDPDNEDGFKAQIVTNTTEWMSPKDPRWGTSFVEDDIFEFDLSDRNGEGISTLQPPKDFVKVAFDNVSYDPEIYHIRAETGDENGSPEQRSVRVEVLDKATQEIEPIDTWMRVTEDVCDFINTYKPFIEKAIKDLIENIGEGHLPQNKKAEILEMILESITIDTECDPNNNYYTELREIFKSNLATSNKFGATDFKYAIDFEVNVDLVDVVKAIPKYGEIAEALQYVLTVPIQASTLNGAGHINYSYDQQAYLPPIYGEHSQYDTVGLNVKLLDAELGAILTLNEIKDKYHLQTVAEVADWLIEKFDLDGTVREDILEFVLASIDLLDYGIGVKFGGYGTMKCDIEDNFETVNWEFEAGIFGNLGIYKLESGTWEPIPDLHIGNTKEEAFKTIQKF